MPTGYEDWTYLRHIDTILADNIIIDLLKQSEQKPYRHWATNDGDSDTPSEYTVSTPLVKCFARGMRGTLIRIQVYVHNSDFIDAHTLTISLGAEMDKWIREYTIAVPAEFEGWRLTSFLGDAWKYDSLYIKLYDSTGNISVGIDLLPSFDYSDTYYWDGSNWHAINYRTYVRILQDTTIGDIPVCGGVTVTSMPNIGSAIDQSLLAVAQQDEEIIASFEGVGELVDLSIYATDSVLNVTDVDYTKQILRFVIDGVNRDYEISGDIYYILAGGMENSFTQVNCPIYTDAVLPVLDDIHISWKLHIPFQKTLDIIWRNTQVGAGFDPTVLVSSWAHTEKVS